MKRILTILAATLLLTAAMAGTASASSYDSVAEELSAIGVFRGTAGGFELDRAPTRSEAAIMLVRLYGAEDEAKAAYEAGEISMPFTDVSETAAPSVAWLYSQGITNGTSATTFGASSPCSAKMYCAFLLRALGYEDGVDFLYADTLDFAMLHGLFNLSMLDAAPFLRDDLAAVTYQALGADLKDGSTYLLASLVESGAIDAEAARPITEKIEAYRALTAASQASSTGIDADYTMNMGMDIAVDGSDGTETIHETMSVAVSGNGRIQMILKDPLQLAISMNMNMESNTAGAGPDVTMQDQVSVQECMQDGWVYVQEEMDGTTDRYKYPVGDMDGFAEFYQEMLQISGQMNSMMLPMIDSIDVSRTGSRTVYTMKMDDSLNSLLEDLLTALQEELAAMESPVDLTADLQSCTYVYTVGSDGELESCTADFDLDLVLGLPVTETENAQITAKLQMDMQMDVNATGDDVRISYPSFSNFEDLTPVLSGGEL